MKKLKSLIPPEITTTKILVAFPSNLLLFPFLFYKAMKNMFNYIRLEIFN